MPDYPIRNGVRALTVFQGTSGLPEDRYVTSWAFRTPGVFATEEDETFIRQALVNFWTTAGSAGGQAMGVYIGGHVIRNLSKVITYRMAEWPPPRTPTEQVFTLPAPSTTVNLPAEVAACMSFYAGVNSPRTRGRVYIGPLCSAAIATWDATKGDARVNVNSMQLPFQGLSAALAARVLPEGQTGIDTLHAIYSPTDLVLRGVTDYWMDDAFDTQRRRGVKASNRVMFEATRRTGRSRTDYSSITPEGDYGVGPFGNYPFIGLDETFGGRVPASWSLVGG